MDHEDAESRLAGFLFRFRFSAAFFFFGCGGLFATTLTARSKRCHASGSSSTCSLFSDLAMASPKKIIKAPPAIVGPKSFHQAVGHAIESYATVEGALAFLLKEILKLTPIQAFVVSAAIQNTRARGEMFDDLLRISFAGKLNPYWSRCSAFLGKLALFRNAIAHWHPHTSIYLMNDDSIKLGDHSLGKLVPGGTDHIRKPDIDLFITDCAKIKYHIDIITAFVRDGPDSLPEKFQPPKVDPNLAVLRQTQKPKEPKPPRPPSVPKLSAAQRRAKALKEARRKGGDG